MTDEKLSQHIGWGFAEIGWLLSRLEDSGCVAPKEFYPIDDSLETRTLARRSRADLAFDMQSCFIWHEMHGELAGGAKEKARRKNLTSLIGQARRIIALLNDDQIMRARLNARIPVDPDTGVGLNGIVEGIKRLKKAAGIELEISKSLGDDGLIPEMNGTPQALLLARLAKVFDKKIAAGRSFGISRTWNDPKGPLVTFIQCAHVLNGDAPLKSDAMAKALERAGLLGQPDNG